MVVPHILKYDNGEGGRQLGPLIRINEKYKDDKGLLAHEIEHVKQWWIVTIISFGLLWFAPLFVEFIWLPFMAYHLLYRVPIIQKWIEVKCWRVQLSHYPHKIDQAAKHLSTMYDFKMTFEQAKRALSR